MLLGKDYALFVHSDEWLWDTYLRRPLTYAYIYVHDDISISVTTMHAL